MSQFLHDANDDNDDAKARATPWVFSKNSGAKIKLKLQYKLEYQQYKNLLQKYGGEI